MVGIRWRDSSIDSGYATDKPERDGTCSVEEKRSADLDGDSCLGAQKDFCQLGLDLKPVRGKGLGLVIAVTTAINIEGEGGGGGEISLLLWGNRPLPTFP